MPRRTDLFYYDCWYVAAWSSDLAPGAHLARVFLDEPVVLFRTESGVAAALEDRCCHRVLPLSCGQVVGDSIRCMYHGLEFATSGVCTRIPAQDKIPSNAKVRSYPLVEQDGFLWIWMGDAEKAEVSAIPRHRYHTDPGWGWRTGTMYLRGNWQLLVDNLMDLSHLPYVHPHTIGGNPELHFKTRTEAMPLPNGVAVQRHLPASVPPPSYVSVKSFKGLVDRWQEIEFHPVHIIIHSGGCDVGTGAYEGKRDHGYQLVGFHGITPETARTTHYIWSVSVNIPGNGAPDQVFANASRTFLEDQAVLEQQQIRLESDPDRPLVDIVSDRGGRLTRQFIRQLLAQQTGSKTLQAV